MAITRAFDIYNIEAESPIAVTLTGAVTRITGNGTPGANDQPAFFIDPVGGDDANAGDTSGTAIKTFQEFVDRIGTQIVNIPMVVTLLNDFPLDNPVYIDPTFHIGSAGSLTLKGGKPLTVLPGSVASVLTGATAINSALNLAQTITDSALPVSWSGAGAVNTATGAMVRIRLTANGAIAYGSMEAPVFALKTMRTSPFNIPASTINAFATPYTPAGNEAYVIETGFVSIADFRVVPSGNSIGAVRIFCFEIALPNSANNNAIIGIWQANLAAGNGEVFMSACDVGRIQNYHSILSQTTCKLSGVAQILKFGINAIAGCLVTQVMALRGLNGSFATIIGLDTLFDVQGRLVVQSTGAQLERVGIFNTAAGTDAITVQPGGNILARTIAFPEAVYGSGNGRAGINCAGSGTFQYQNNVPTITGTTDTRIQAVDLPYAQTPFLNVKNHVIDAGIMGALTGGVTRFINPNYTESATDDSGWLVHEPAVIRSMRVLSRTPAGAGGDVYTVFINGVASAVVATMAAGGTTATSLTTAATVTAGQRISFSILEGAAGASNVILSLEVLATNSTGAGIFRTNPV